MEGFNPSKAYSFEEEQSAIKIQASFKGKKTR